MRKMKSIVVAIIFALGCIGCDTAWDNYFAEQPQEEGSVSSLNLMEYLKSKSEYSSFTGLIEEVGFDKELEKDQMMTVWALSNEHWPIEVKDYSLSQKKQFIKNHLNYVALYRSKLKEVVILNTLANKVLTCSMDKGVFYIEKVGTLHLNQMCKNGVVHEVKEALLPQMNIYEYLESCGDDYSVFRDTLFAYNDTVFRPDLSIPTGEDEWGSTVYDSVFVIENPFFVKGDIRQEMERLTLMLPSNDVIKRMMVSITNFFTTIGREFTAKDTSEIMNWMLKSSLHSGAIENYAQVSNRNSLFGVSWRTDKQYVKEEYESCSNGNIYFVTTMIYPKLNYMRTIEIRPVQFLYMSEEMQRLCYNYSSDVSFSAGTQSEQSFVWINISGSSTSAFFEFGSYVQNEFGNMEEISVMPGIYQFCTSFRGYGCGNIDLYVKTDEGEEKVLTFNPAKDATGNTKPEQKRGKYEFIPIKDAGSNKAPNGSDGLLMAKFEVKAEWGYKPLRFILKNAGGKDRMTLQYFLLKPTEDNY